METKNAIIAIIGFWLMNGANCWSPSIHIQQHKNPESKKYRKSFLYSKSEAGPSDSSDPVTEIINKSDSNQPSAAFGVSFIGGDPCGSKYNDDPFGASKDVVKPGMPDEMKDRIAAMAAELLKKQQSKENN
ncbi:hypothetical protein ACHAWO_006685 [Cyclotella atomus]|uniref:Uncharacterized protein n=1 Tax=Cyclotella atomus TaxID=382360 RepID=A0ABD3Q9J9_9STRA